MRALYNVLMTTCASVYTLTLTLSLAHILVELFIRLQGKCMYECISVYGNLCSFPSAAAAAVDKEHPLQEQADIKVKK